MPKYKILDTPGGTVINTILASEKYMLETYPYHELVVEVRAARNKTIVTAGDLIALLDNEASGTPTPRYAKIYREAYPQGNKPEDDMSLGFLERAKHPKRADGLIDLSDPMVETGLNYFRDNPVFNVSQADVDRVLAGVEV